MKEPPTTEEARGNGQVTTGPGPFKRGEDSISQAMRNPEMRSGDTTGKAMVCEVMEDLVERQLLPVEMLCTDAQRRSEPERRES